MISLPLMGMTSSDHTRSKTTLEGDYLATYLITRAGQIMPARQPLQGTQERKFIQAFNPEQLSHLYLEALEMPGGAHQRVKRQCTHGDEKQQAPFRNAQVKECPVDVVALPRAVENQLECLK